jgi:hypothetical protein
MGENMVNYKKIIAIFLCVAMFICLGLGVYLDNHYAYTRPEKPQPEIGRVYPLNIHGTIVYLTKKEDLQMKWLFRGMMIFFVLIALFTFFYNPFPQYNKSP